MFTFDWPYNYSTKHEYGLVKANSTTLVGFLKVDSRIACNKECYLGLEYWSNKRSSSSLKFLLIDWPRIYIVYICGS